ncbi:MAG: biotin--[acetyl-CoA-carboxylase] ligase [Rhodospirillales bacterium]|nr:MAG: biotin--[acetyl-CoA-carboxylase] ligase [Rhodospirillales bacterium]
MDRDVVLPAGYWLVVHETIDSTNAEAARLAQQGAADGTVIWARHQTAGRGRHGRRWQSPEGNLYCSLLLRPEAPPAKAAQLSLAAALALGDALDDLLPAASRPAFKWPNDVLIGGRKVAGILLESSGSHDGCLDWLVVGCGLNVRHFPEGTDHPATSLHAAGVANAVVGDLLAAFVHAFAGWRARWQRSGPGPLREGWLARAAHIGGEIAVRLPGDELRGRFAGLDAAGALLVDLPDGSRRTVSAGDVFFQRG